MDISSIDIVTLILIAAVILVVGFILGSVCMFFWYDKHATKIFNENQEEVAKAIGLYQKEIDILKTEIEEDSERRKSISMIKTNRK